ncbi:unnamed protein product [Dracunculus medinensis]|uniref:AB hydrolase-1 domain-containing protein n=1 Tax=Dracunculus medinensis TaxID=318479 RepID=A0A3P7SE40_DRAME|nr:unnamed protein product [Dracunculus medinensis]
MSILFKRFYVKWNFFLQVISVQTTRCGFIHVYIQGNLENRNGKTMVMTVHDVGTNYKAFPTLDQIGEDLVCVLDKLDVKTCIAFGEGAGANIICRFAMSSPNRIMGICLVHCTSTTAGIIEYCKDKLINMRLESGVMSQGAWDYLAMHKFGSSDKKEKQAYIEELKSCLNPKNLSKYLFSFCKRSDISSLLGSKLENMDALLVTGARASHLHTVYTTHKSMNKRKTTLLVVDNVSDVMAEAPEKLARSLILLCKGCGVMSGVAIPGMERQRTLSRFDEFFRFSISIN